jgi:GntR family transcriptional regulator
MSRSKTAKPVTSRASVLDSAKARRIYLSLRDRIHNGALPPGSRLPGEPTMAAQFGVSRLLVRRALDLLVVDKLVDRRLGSGSYVRDPAVAPPLTVDLADVWSHLFEMGRRTDVKLIALSFDRPSMRLRDLLNLKSGETVQRALRVRSTRGEPFSHLVSFVPESLGRSFTEADLATTPLLQLFERSGVIPATATQTVGAALAGPEIAERLDVDVGTPLLTLSRTVFDTKGRGIEHLEAHYRPDLYEFQMNLIRTGNPKSRHWEVARSKSVA